MALVALAAIQIGLDVAATTYALLNRPKQNVANPTIDQISLSANGAPIPFGYGTVRVGAQIIWSSGINFTKRVQSSKGGPNITYYNYFCSFAAAFGEGPACVKRVWADSKLIYVDPGITSSEFPAEDFPQWSNTALYNPGNIVGYFGQVYQALVTNTNVIPGSDITKWQLISDYPPWDSGTNYSVGDVVAYPGTNGALYVAQAPSLDVGPTSGSTTTVNGETVLYWIPLSQAYVQPTIYPGDELQMPDPTIQASETASYTPAYRGLCYGVWERLALLNFGNRLPNFRAEIGYYKVRNIL